MAEKKIVEAVANMSSVGSLGQRPKLAHTLEEAAGEAVRVAMSEGHSIADSSTILVYKAYARAKVLEAYGEKVTVPARPAPKKVVK